MGALDEGHFCDDLDGTTMGFNNVDLVVENEYSSIEDAVKILLQGLGEDCEREGLKKTPLRVAKAFREGTRGYQQDVDDIVQGALFPEAGLDNGLGHAGGAGGLVVVRDIDLFSYCESCLLPFKVKCHVGYVPSGRRVVGLSKLSRVAEVFAKRLQDPHRLATEICTSLNNSIKPSGVAVALQCWHLQFPTAECNAHDSHEATKTGMRGWIQICAYSGSGVFENKNTESWFDFLAMLKFKGVNIEKSQKQSSPAQSWCPSKSHELGTCHGHSSRHSLNGKTSSHKQGTIPSSMVSAVSSIIHSLGENPSRKELVGTPRRFVQWIMNFRRANLEMKFNNSCNPIREIRNIDKNEIHSELNLPFWSQCEHHLLPFHGVVHIGYLGAQDSTSMDRPVLQSIVHFYGCKLQVQERLTRQIAETVSSLLSRSVIVVVEANHICMISRGIEKVGSSTATIAVLGQFSSDPTAKANFLQIISNHTFYDA